MKKNILITAILFIFLCNFTSAQIKNEQIIGKWRVYKRAYTNDTASHGAGSPLKMDLIWAFTSDSLIWDFTGISKQQVIAYTIKDSTLSIGPMKYSVERLYNDTFIVRKAVPANRKGAVSPYVDYFKRVDAPKK